MSSTFWTSFLAALCVCLVVPTSTANEAGSPRTLAVPEASGPEALGQEDTVAGEVPGGSSRLAVDTHAAAVAGLSPDVLRLALSATACGISTGDLVNPPTLTVIDYSRPSTDPRFWVFDLTTGDLLFAELVAHGQGTGDDLAVHFSDRPNSHQSSIGLFVARETYVGSNGYSMRMDGLEPGFNGRARERAIVMHGAPYVSAEFVASTGRLGRSWGCPALREAVARDVIDTVSDGGVVFSYYPDSGWLQESRFLNCDRPLRVAHLE